MSTGCPAPEVLRRFALEEDDLGPRGLDEHLEACARCRDQLDRLLEGSPEPARPHPGPPRIQGYEISEPIGRGGYGVVYRARQNSLGRPVAVKLMPRLDTGAPHQPERWLHEARAAASVRHPHILTIHEVGSTEGWNYLVMDLVEGGSLADRLAQGPLDPRIAAALFATVARAVENLHRQGLLHRDLKPANILLDGRREDPIELCRPIVADFGLARKVERSGSMTTIGHYGTPGYMPPEQAWPDRCRGRGGGGTELLGPTLDVYALGASLYHALTGRPPIQGASELETLVLLLDDEPVAPRRLVRSIPRDLETIVLKCLRHAPGDRYATAAELADDLGRFLDNRPIRARPPHAFVRFKRWGRRHPGALAFGAVVLLGVGTLVASWQRAERLRIRAETSEKQVRDSLTRTEANLNRARQVEKTLLTLLTRGRIDDIEGMKSHYTPVAPWSLTVAQIFTIMIDDITNELEMKPSEDRPELRANGPLLIANAFHSFGLATGDESAWRCRVPAAVATLAMHRRTKNRMDQAESLLARAFELLDQLSPADRDTAAYHVAACEVWSQKAKQITRGGNRRAVFEALERALQEAQIALEMDPKGRGLVELCAVRRQKLQRFYEAQVELTGR